jgi:GH25 family lysozyme M1 (1,4-beta-N-acetylmuramidase)
MRGLCFATLRLTSCAMGGDPAGDSRACAGLGSEVDSTGSPEVGILARVCAAGTTTRGVDVSYFNGTIDWTKVEAAGDESAVNGA